MMRMFCFFMVALSVSVGAADCMIGSPNGRVSFAFTLEPEGPSGSVRLDNRTVAEMRLGVFGGAYHVVTTAVRKVRAAWTPVVGIRSVCPDAYDERVVELGSALDPRPVARLSIRAYDEGVAVRAEAMTEIYSNGSVASERTSLRFADGTEAWSVKGTEDTFSDAPVAITRLGGGLRCMPFVVRIPSAGFAAVMEADVRDWPRSKLKCGEDGSLRFVYENGARDGRGWVRTPWRVILLADAEGGLIGNSHLVETLNPPSRIEDTSWLRPGLTVSDMENCELRTEEILASARQARELGARYFQLDWGWYGTEYAWTESDRAAFRRKRPDLASEMSDGTWVANTKADPTTTARGFVPYHPIWPYDIHRRDVDLDMPKIVRELDKMGMGLCLYVHGDVLEKADLDRLFALYESWGVKGLKPGFVSYGSQRATTWLRTMIETAARHHLWLDIHDAYIPDGLSRTYPNLFISEGGGGQEGRHPVVQDVMLPFTRCLAGPFDYTPLLFDPTRTHAHMVAMLLVYPGPTAIVRGSLAKMRTDDSELLRFVAAIPWKYDESRVVQAKIGEHLVVARRFEDVWYLAGICGEKETALTFGLDWLNVEGEYDLQLWQDAVGGRDRPAQRVEKRVKRGQMLSVRLASAGGFCAVLRPTLKSPRRDFIRLRGRIGEKARRLFAARVYSDEARGPVLDEAVNAFRTHFDDDTNRVSKSRWDYWLKPEFGGWQGEYWGKSMLAACAVVGQSGDIGLAAWLDRQARDLVREFQQPDGYLSTYADRLFLGGPKDARNEFCWNIWGRKYTVWALLEIFHLCDNPDLMTAARRIIDNEAETLKRHELGFGETGFFAGLPSSSSLVPLMKLYHATGETHYLELARGIVRDWDRADGRRPNLVRNARSGRFIADWYGDTDWAKAYEMMSCLEGLVDFAQAEKRPDLLHTVVVLRDLMAEDELNVMDSVGEFDHFRHARGKRVHRTELCDAIHWMRLNKALYLATGDDRCLNYIERAFLNAFLAGVWRDGRWCAHEVRASGDAHWAAPAQTGMFRHQCCVDNAPRGFVDFASLAILKRSDCYEVNFLEPFEASVDGIRFEMTGDYPHSGTPVLSVDSGSRQIRVRVRAGDRCETFAVLGKRTIKLTVPLKVERECFAGGVCVRRGPVLQANVLDVLDGQTNVVRTCPFSEVADCECPDAPFTVWKMETGK